ncbi:MAG: alpha/beta hydrolase family protein [Victivallaceae bacterium]|nr:alpha/beta hydrolase family protein [Victivallaceae bacterium]
MAFFECHFFSRKLGKMVAVNAILPECPAKPPRVLYLLHGLSDDCSAWCRRSSIERYAENFGLAVIMPDGGRGFYTDAKSGPHYWSFVADELPQLVHGAFKLSHKREETFAAGMSMGGYGALKLALRHPDRFAGAAGLSSVADIAARHQRAQEQPGFNAEMNLIFGKAPAAADNLFSLSSRVVGAKRIPRLFMACGTEDFLYADNLRLRDHLKEIGYPGFHYEEGPGEHNWSFWDCRIQNALKYLLS